VHRLLSQWPVAKPLKLTMLRRAERLEVIALPTEAPA
jgi:hypothetical protein